MKDLKTKERFIELRATGLSYSRIATEFGVAKQTFIEWSRDLPPQKNREPPDN